MYIIAGMGNPGEKYHGTRHNIGFYCLDLLAEAFSVKINKIKHKAICGEGMIGQERVILAKPQTYMNNSGESLLSLKNYYKVENNRIIVIYDDIDLPSGVLRIRPSGGPGTHRGMQSVIYQLQSEDFPRVRIGVDNPPEGWDLADYVLSRFNDEEEIEKVKDACSRAVHAIETIMTEGLREAMNKYNG